MGRILANSFVPGLSENAYARVDSNVEQGNEVSKTDRATVKAAPVRHASHCDSGFLINPSAIRFVLQYRYTIPSRN